jgi:hypothetical protein
MGIIKWVTLAFSVCALLSLPASAKNTDPSLKCLAHLGGGGLSDYECYGGLAKELESRNEEVANSIAKVSGTTSADKASLERYMRAQDEALKSCDLAVQLSYSWKIDTPPKTHINMYDVVGARCRYMIRKQQNDFLRDLYSIYTG